MVAYSFEGWKAHQSLGFLLTRRMESAGLQPIGFVANDYALATYSLKPVEDPGALFSPNIPRGGVRRVGARARLCCAAPSGRWR